MSSRQQLLQQVAALNPNPDSEPLPDALCLERPDADAFIEGLLLDQAPLEPDTGSDRAVATSPWRGPLVAVAAAVTVVAVVVAGSLLLGGAEPLAPTETTTTVSSTSTTLVETALPDPWGLGDTTHPANQAEVNTVFLGMPDTLAGMAASRDDADHVGFVNYRGDDGWASIAWIEAGIDTASTIGFLTGIEALDEFTTVASDLTNEHNLIWLVGIGRPPGDETQHLAWWGDPAGGWIFSAEASTPERLDTVIAAYLAAIEQSSIDGAIPTTIPSIPSATAVPPSTTPTTTTVPIDPTDAATWIGHHFVVVDDIGTVLERQDLLDVGSRPTFVLIDGEEAGVYPWVTGFTSYQRGDRIDVLIVGPDPIEYPPEAPDAPEPTLPIDPSSDTSYTLTVWALAPSADLSNGYRITDTMEVEIPQTILATRGFISIGYEPWRCELEAPLGPEGLFGFFDDNDTVEVETNYAPYLAFRVEDGSLKDVPQDKVSCIIRLDPENY